VGRYEGSFVLSPTPAAHKIDAYGSAAFTLHVQSIGSFDEDVHLTLNGVFPDLDVTLEPSTVGADTSVSLTAVDRNGSDASRFYTIPILGTSTEFSETIHVSLLVNAKEQYLPLIVRD
jgi:hypothetical protein